MATSTENAIELLSQRRELMNCLQQCELAMAAIMGQQQPIDIFAMELAAWNRHKKRIEEIENQLATRGIAVPADEA